MEKIKLNNNIYNQIKNFVNNKPNRKSITKNDDKVLEIEKLLENETDINKKKNLLNFKSYLLEEKI